MRGFPDLPPIWWASSLAFIYLMKWALPDLHFQSEQLALVSRIVFFASLAIIAWSAIWFWKKKTPIEPHHAPKALIIEGPYRLSRNPIYLALVMLTISSALGHGSIFGGVAAVLLWAILDRRFAAKEEIVLIGQFGDEALAYIAETRRWL